MALTNPSTFLGCAPKTAFLADYFGKNVPAGRENGDLSFLQFLLSPANTSGVRKLSDDIKGVPGKKRGVELMFTTPMCVKIAATPYNCADPREPLSPAVQYAAYEIETEYHPVNGAGDLAELVFTDTDFAQYCELDDELFIQDQFNQHDMSMFKAIDKEMVTLLNGLIDVSRVVNLPFIKTNTATGYEALSDEWLMWVSEKLDLEGINVMDCVIFGGRMVKKIAHKYKVATASTEGFDLSKTSGEVPELYFNRNFDAVFGTNAFVVIPKKSLQLVTFNKYVGAKGVKTDLAVNFTKTMPLGNGASITFDYKWRRDIDCNAYKYFPTLDAELVKTVPGSCDDPDFDGLLIFKDCGENAIPECPAPAPI